MSARSTTATLATLAYSTGGNTCVAVISPLHAEVVLILPIATAVETDQSAVIVSSSVNVARRTAGWRKLVSDTYFVCFCYPTCLKLASLLYASCISHSGM